jgi:hypothetical protein
VARSFVEKVESNLKGGVVAQPGKKTLILGRNGRGKSAIVNAIELAGTGAASDVAGRALMKLDADLSMLAPPGAEKVWSKARMQGGGEASWELSKGHKAKRAGIEIAFPLRDVRAALLGSPETARKWILSVGSQIDRKEILALMPTSLHKRLDSIWPDGPLVGEGGADAANDLVFALEAAKRRVRDLNATARAARAFQAPSQPPPTDADITATEAVIQAWIERGADAPPADTLTLVSEARVTAEIRVDGLVQQATNLEAQLAALPPPNASLELRRAAVLVVEALASTQATDCAICGGKTNLADLRLRAEKGRAKINETIAIEKRREDLTFAHREVMNDLGPARRELQRCQTEEARAKTAMEKRAADERPAPTITLADAKAKLQGLHTLRAAWAAARRGEEQALQAERDAIEWTQLSEALSSALGTLVEKARVAFCAEVQRYLPPSDLFGLDLVDGEREVLRVGLLRLSSDKMVLHAALSGAEWARVTAALALATAPGEGPCVVCPEERAFDAETLSDVLAAFDAAVAGDDDAPQIVITSPTAPTKIPPEWIVIHVGDDADAIKVAPPDEPPKKGGRKNGPAGKKPAEPKVVDEEQKRVDDLFA